MADAIPPSTNGQNSTEYQTQQSAKLWGNVGVILGAVVAIGPIVTGVIPPDSKAMPIVGGLISLASLVYKTLIDLGFIKGRTDVKVAQQNAVAAANATSAPSSTVTVNQEK